MVLHRVLAMAARTFLLNDLGDELDDERRRTGTVDALHLSMGHPPTVGPVGRRVLARGPSAVEDPTERIHQSRVAMRRIRSNLRTFRLLLDPGWGTALRAELAWYGNELGRSRDLELLAAVVADAGPRGARLRRDRPAAGRRRLAARRGGGADRRRPGRAPPVPADRADDGAVGRARRSRPRRPGRPPRSCRSMLAPVLARPARCRPARPGRTPPTSTSTSCGSG